jgi:hypothetical protein
VNHQGQVIAAWMDQRSNASGDLYLQNINPDGSLGDLSTAPNPSLTITSPADSSEAASLPLSVLFEAQNFAIAPSGGDGVLAVNVNGTNVEWHTSTNAVQIASLAEGMNSIVLELVHYDHSPLDPPVMDSVHVNYTPNAIHDGQASLPTTPELYPAYPNPFNPTATITFALPKSEHVRLTVFDVLGNEVARLMDGTLGAGYHRVQFDGARLAGGAIFAACRRDR